MNTYCAVGNLSQDIDYFENETFCSASTSIALNEYYKDKDGNKQENVTFLPIKGFSTIAKNMKAYLKKGSKVAIVGKLTSDEWTDKDTGKKRNKIVCKLDAIDFLEKKDDGNETNS